MRSVIAAAAAACVLALTGCGGSSPAAQSSTARATARACRTLRAWALHPPQPLAADITQDPVRFQILRQAAGTPFATDFRHWLEDEGTTAAVIDADRMTADCHAAGAGTRGLFGPGT